MAKKLPDFSVRPVVIRTNSVKLGLFALASGIGAAWLGFEALNSHGIDWIFLAAASFLIPTAFWLLLSGPETMRIGDDTVQLLEQKTWWSLPSTSEWPISDFECVRLNSEKWEDGSVTWDIWLKHTDGHEVHLEVGARDEDYAFQFAHDAARALNLPMLLYDP